MSSCNAEASGIMRTSYKTCLAGKLALRSTEEKFSCRDYLLLSEVTEDSESSQETSRRMAMGRHI